MQPIVLLDQAEAARAAGNAAEAHAAYRELAEWAADNPYGDGWGATALAPYALWRWVGYAHATEDPDEAEVDAILAADEALRTTRLSEAIYTFPLLDTLPQLREETLRGLAILARHAGRNDEAPLLLLDYLAISREADLDGEAAALRDEIVAKEWATADNLDLLRARRLRQLARFEEAEATLERLTASSIDHVRVEASLQLATLRLAIHDDDFSPQMRREVAAVLGRVIDEARDPRILQDAYLARGMLYLREGSGQSVDLFVDDMETIVAEFPKGQQASEALYQLAEYSARQHRLTGSDEMFDGVLDTYERLRSLPTPHGREDSMYYRPALALYTRGSSPGAERPDDIDEALRLFEELERVAPAGPYYLPSLLWQGRIAEQRGDRRAAERIFERLAAEDAYSYYGIRALMHLQEQDGATTRLLPGPEVREALAVDFAASTAPTAMQGSSPYHERLRQLLASGRYAAALATLRDFRRRSPTTLRNTPLRDLDDGGELADIVLLLAARQDAMSARDRDPSPTNRLEIGATLGSNTDDWPAALSAMSGRVPEPEHSIEIRRHPAYLQVAYPPVHVDRFARAAARFDGVDPALLYSIARRESLFDASAVSAVGAVGLFQFMPNTFAALDQRWTLMQEAGVDSRREFLFDVDRTVDLGARYVREELLSRYGTGDGLLFALMDHSAGARAVRTWREEWEAIGRGADVEYMVDTVRIAETRGLLRGVLGDLAVVSASGLFRAGGGADAPQ